MRPRGLRSSLGRLRPAGFQERCQIALCNPQSTTTYSDSIRDKLPGIHKAVDCGDRTIQLFGNVGNFEHGLSPRRIASSSISPAARCCDSARPSSFGFPASPATAHSPSRCSATPPSSRTTAPSRRHANGFGSCPVTVSEPASASRGSAEDGRAPCGNERCCNSPRTQ